MSDELTELPDGWVWTNFEELAEKIPNALKAGPFGSALKKSFYVPSGYKIYGQEQVINEDPFFGDYYIDEERYEALKSCAVKPGDILISLVGTIGKVLILPGGIKPGIINPRLVKLSLDKTVANNEYIKKYLESSTVRNYFSSLSHGGTMDILNLSILKTLKISLPPLEEQKRIVAKIEELHDRHQTAKQALEAVPKLCDRFRQSVLAAAFRGDLTADWREENPDVEPTSVLLGRADNSLPATWHFASIGDVIESLKYGTSKKSDYETEGVPVLRIPNIGHGYVNHTDLKYSDLSSKEVEDLKLLPGDILLIRSNGSVSLVGKSAVIRESETGFVYAGYLIRLRLNPLLIDSEYLNLCLLSRDLRLQIEVPARSTSGVHNINSQEVKNLKIPFPPIKEQKEIVRNIEFLFKAIDKIMQQYEGSAVQLDRLNQSILAKAFRGELVEQDPNDEPASVLLDCIRAERQAQEGKKSGVARGKRKKASNDQLDLPGLE